MARLHVQIQTALALRDVAFVFQQSMKYNVIREFLGRGTRFSKPPADEAFGDLDDDPPTFSVMATLGDTNGAQATDVVLFGWDRGDHRDFLIMEGRALLSVGIVSKWKVKKFITKLQEMDSAVRVEGI